MATGNFHHIDMATGRPRMPGIYDGDVNYKIGNDMWIIGADEVGRGCLAGPVTVCAVLAPATMTGMGVTDSKKLSAKKRVEIDAALRTHPSIRWALVSVPASDIDRFGIMKALRICFGESVRQMLLEHKINPNPTGKMDLDPKSIRVLIDGMPMSDMDFTAEYIVKGDATVWAIGAASIIAKVHRDDYMAGVPSTTHPVYGWADNAGYGTANHIAAIRAHGLTPMHRASFCRAFVPGGVVAKEATMDSASNIIEDLFG